MSDTPQFSPNMPNDNAETPEVPQNDDRSHSREQRSYRSTNRRYRQDRRQTPSTNYKHQNESSRDDSRDSKRELPNKREQHSKDDRSQNISVKHSNAQKAEYSARTDKRWIPSISVVIPMFNEEESLPELLLQLEAVLNPLARGRYEVLFIDDGSTDTSFDIIRKANRSNSRIRGIRFRRNYGKSAALSVGFAEARHDIVFTMDADLQDDPNELPLMVAKIDEGFDLVSGWKKKRHDPLEKRLPSKFFNYVTSLVSGITLHDFNCGLKAYRREVVKSVQVYGEMHRYIPALAYWEGFRVTEMPVQHHARKYGVSKFGFSRYLKGFLDLLTVVFTTRFIKRPLHLFGAFGALLMTAGLVIDAYLVIEWAMGLTYLTNRPLLFMGIAFIIVGVQLISMGLLGEMIVKNSLNNNEYSIREMV